MTDGYREPCIIFVPGKNPKPRAQEHAELVWRCLLNGVGRVDEAVAADIANTRECFHLVAWNYLYYQHHKSLEVDLPYIEQLLKTVGATDRERRHVHSWRTRLGRLAYTVADWIPWLVRFVPDPAVKAAILETSRYFHNDKNIGCEIRQLLKDRLCAAWEDDRRVLLIGHSMGSIIAYDALWELGRQEGKTGSVDLFLTLGSPLGMRFVQHRLVDAGFSKQRYPDNIRQWINIASRGDLTALDPYLADDYEEMVNLGLIESIRDEHKNVYNFFHGAKGMNMHRSYGYLVNPNVGDAIAEWWRGGDRGSQ